ncbi:unnamed protein product [Prunus armeniaca]
MIPWSSRERRNSGISIRITFEPRMDLAYCAIFEFDMFEPLDRSHFQVAARIEAVSPSLDRSGISKACEDCGPACDEGIDSIIGVAGSGPEERTMCGLIPQ